jgi:protein ImuA
VLFALEEGVRCRDFAFVIGELAGNPRALDLTSSRRLSLAAEKYGVPLMLVRLDAERDLSSARMRWQMRSAPSPTPEWNPFAPGAPAWRAELFRVRGHAPGKWILRRDGQSLTADRLAASAPDYVDLAVAAGGRSLAAG